MSVMSRKIPVTFDHRAPRTVCFRRVSHRGIYGENGKNSSIPIRTILGFSFIMHCKLITQWVKYAFGCVCLDLSITGMKKSSENSEFSATWQLKLKFAYVLNVALSIIHHDTGGKQKRKVKEIIVAVFFFL